MACPWSNAAGGRVRILLSELLSDSCSDGLLVAVGPCTSLSVGHWLILRKDEKLFLA